MNAKIRRLSPETLREALLELERRYGMSSPDLYDRYRAGDLGDGADSPDFVHWAGLCYMAARRGLLTRPAVQA
jgi:hypothetical protein